MRKNLDISPEAVAAITIDAVRKNPKNCFKLYAEQILEEYALRLIEAEKLKENGGKNIYVRRKQIRAANNAVKNLNK